MGAKKAAGGGAAHTDTGETSAQGRGVKGTGSLPG